MLTCRSRIPFQYLIIVLCYIPTPKHWQLSGFGIPSDSVVFRIVLSNVKFSDIPFFEWGWTPHENPSFESRLHLTHCTNENRLLLSSETTVVGKLLPHGPATQHDTGSGKINFAIRNLVSRHIILELLVLTNQLIPFLTWKRSWIFHSVV